MEAFPSAVGSGERGRECERPFELPCWWSQTTVMTTVNLTTRELPDLPALADEAVRPGGGGVPPQRVQPAPPGAGWDGTAVHAGVTACVSVFLWS
jgi:hypothetical protein